MPLKISDTRTAQRSYCWISKLKCLQTYPRRLTLVPAAVIDLGTGDLAGRASIQTDTMAIMAQARIKSDKPVLTEEAFLEALEASTGLSSVDCKLDAPEATIATPVVTRMWNKIMMVHLSFLDIGSQ
jgi:hypothetical protein